MEYEGSNMGHKVTGEVVVAKVEHSRQQQEKVNSRGQLI